MCGRYASSRNPDELRLEFEVDAPAGLAGAGPGEDVTGAVDNYNVAPTDRVPVVVERLPRPVDGADEPSGWTETNVTTDSSSIDVGGRAFRWLRLLQWGLVPPWAKDRSVASRMINARVETLLDRAYRRPALARRCLVPADGWYEWQRRPTTGGSGTAPAKQPYFMSATTGQTLAFAGVYEFWRNDALHPDDPAAWLTSFTVITMAAEPDLGHIHDRMPLVLPRDRWDDWLDPDLRDESAVRHLIRAPEPGRFAARPVSSRVNSVRENGPDLVTEVQGASIPPGVDPLTGEVTSDQAALF
jgi:putative SOS response-associated peptidase YedK